MAGDLALLGSADPLRSARACTLVHAATHHDAQSRSLRQTVPGIGNILRLGLFSAMHDLERLPRVQAVVSSCRLGQWAKASAGKRSGFAGTKIGNASLQWACSAAAGLLLRDHPAGQKALTR